MRLTHILLIFVWSVFATCSFTARADSSTYAASPSQGTTNSSPLVMFVLSLDHELFKKAYSDLSDIDGDGILDTTYKDTIDYYGYFSNDICYEYLNQGPDWQFFRTDSLATGPNNHSCSHKNKGLWSGNFLNWATMTRMDVLRKVLYGGKRHFDDPTLTLLKRAELPFDFHAFSKTYSGPDVQDFTPYDSPSISLCNLTQTRSGPPIVRVKKSNFPEWGGLSRTRCQGSSDEDFYVINETCSISKSSNCMSFPRGLKPQGILQKYGQQVKFGLMSGSFDKNTSGGVLRKNISFSTDEIDQTYGEFTNIPGIISTIDAFRVSEYSYDTQRYYCGGSPPVRCRDWGNPISEIYFEALRYIKGYTNPSSDYTVGNDLGMAKPPWQDPYSSSNSCANCTVIILASGQNSYDADNYNNINDVLSGMTELNNRTDNVGNLEPGLNFPGNFIIGDNGGTGITQCDPKNLTGLSSARGICPEIPEHQGSYYVAGLAHYAKTNDLRSDLEGTQNVTTYAVELAQTIPALTFNVPDGLGKSNTVSVTPICQTILFAYGFNENAYRPCRYLDQSINDLTLDSNGLLTSISFRIGWADEPYGGDGDTDSQALYTITTGINSITVRLHDPIFNGANSFRYGYAISGVQNYNGMVFDAEYDDLYTPNINQSYDDGDNQSALIIKQCREASWTPLNCRQNIVTSTDVTKTFIPSSNNLANSLPKPLVLAAKYGGFYDLDNDGTPNHDSNGDGIPDNDNKEWDTRNNTTGAASPDSIPDNYFFSNNPVLIEAQLEDILSDITSRVSSGTNAALISNSSSGVSSVIQGLFRPKIEVKDKTISWVGFLHSLFVDTKGHFREDTNKNQTLDDYKTDRVVTLFFDTNEKSTVIQRHTSNDDGVTLIPDGPTAALSDLKPVWDAKKRLLDITNTNTQRSYNAPSNTGRHIFTWLDSDNNNTVTESEVLPFDTNTFVGANSGYLNVLSTESDKLVKFIRGEDQTSFRSRSIDYDNDGVMEVWRLGDIVHSNPVGIASPSGYYNDNKPYNFSDSTFLEFQNHYKNRRQVVYVGANDGMIHAFNAGFWDNENLRFDLTRSGETPHPLGGEIWAYAPMNLLPHLKWLTEPSYPHVYYMDGPPLIFDANIFPPDTDHPKGWGTVLVMGMRLGGGDINVSINNTNKTMRSAYVVLDITNPEKPPTLMAEITHPEIGFTTNRPVVIQRRKPDNSGRFDPAVENNWYLAFGSGPMGSGTSGIKEAINNATSEQNMKVFVYDLHTKSFINQFTAKDSGFNNAYAGGMTVVDWNLDYYDDLIYFGSVETSGSLSGKLLRINLEDPKPDNWTLSIVTDPKRPITASPTTVTNNENERWIYAGTGRELTLADSQSTQQEFFFGVKEPTIKKHGSLGTSIKTTYSYGTVDFDSLVDTTDVQVEADGDLTATLTISPGNDVTNFDALLKGIKSEAGWKNRLIYDNNRPSSKSTTPSLNVFSSLIFTEYLPPVDACLIEGVSFLQALHYQTGTPTPANIQKVLTPDGFNNDTVSTRKISLGTGKPPAPTIHRDSDGQTSIIVQGGAGNITSTDLEYSFRANGRQSWRQIFDIPRPANDRFLIDSDGF